MLNKVFTNTNNICDAARDLVTIVQFKKHLWKSMFQFTKSNTPLWGQ